MTRKRDLLKRIRLLENEFRGRWVLFANQCLDNIKQWDFSSLGHGNVFQKKTTVKMARTQLVDQVVLVVLQRGNEGLLHPVLGGKYPDLEVSVQFPEFCFPDSHLINAGSPKRYKRRIRNNRKKRKKKQPEKKLEEKKCDGKKWRNNKRKTSWYFLLN